MRGNNNNSNNNNNNNSNINLIDYNMETSFYEENEQFTVGNNKRPLTLDLNSKSPLGKKQRLNQNTVTPLVIGSPDLQSFKLTTPDIEGIVLNGLPTPTPGTLQFPKFPAGTQGTTEQEDYVKGFVDALNSLHKKDSQPTNMSAAAVNAVVLGPNGMSGGSITYTNLDDSFPVAIKDEPQTVPNSPPLSPIDMETQERIKLERKRQRNRVAASKCRKRKLERISKLEDKVKQLKGENVELSAIIKQLRENVFSLKEQVLEHIKSGCMIPYCETK